MVCWPLEWRSGGHHITWREEDCDWRWYILHVDTACNAATAADVSWCWCCCCCCLTLGEPTKTLVTVFLLLTPVDVVICCYCCCNITLSVVACYLLEVMKNMIPKLALSCAADNQCWFCCFLKTLSLLLQDNAESVVTAFTGVDAAYVASWWCILLHWDSYFVMSFTSASSGGICLRSSVTP